MQLFHIATVTDWEAAQRSGFYTTSTLGVTLQQEGFLHTSRGDQWEGVRSRYYASVAEPLVLLVIDSDRLTSPWQEDPVGDDTYPHIYGPLSPDAVITTVPLGPLPMREAAPSATTPTASSSGQTFAQAFLGEVFYRIALAILLMLLAFGGAALFGALHDGLQWVGALLGLAVGGGIAWLIHLGRRTDA